MKTETFVIWLAAVRSRDSLLCRLWLPVVSIVHANKH